MEAPAPLRPAAWRALPGWAEDRPSEALPALLESCRALAAMPAGRELGGAGEAARRGGSPAAWRDACAGAAALDAALARLTEPRLAADGRRARMRARLVAEAREYRARRFFERRFQPFAVAEPGLLTGYYEPVLRGAREPDETYHVPLYARPPELAEATIAPLAQGGVAGGLAARRAFGRWRDGRLEPLPTRAQIEDGALAGRGLELVYVDDPVEAFFLHIQGSGRVVLRDGTLLRVGYAGQNGRPYHAIGRTLIERGEIPRERMSMQAIRDWLNASDWEGWERGMRLMRENPSFVFFRLVEGLRPDQGPIGALGVPLTPMRSIAVDPAFVPLGAPVFVATRAREGEGERAAPPLRRLVVAQDTGGAIRGPARGDLFVGWGPEAGDRAGRMREPVEMFVLLPRQGATEMAEYHEPPPRP
ncbi:murein transglycosylase A [Caldovatus sediminis]|uniref:murein transglycosylase A n=1 Tax=Caldovatus sediminis TaxID=2041189 RepID=UPI001E51F09F|nr:MltA domain-containing protein [Caldovatus sediminis]